MSDEKYNPIQAPITGRFSSGAGPRYQKLAKAERTLAARDAVYGAAMAAFRLPQDAPTVEELWDDLQRAYADTIAAKEKRSVEALTRGQYVHSGLPVRLEGVHGVLIEIYEGESKIENVLTNLWTHAVIEFQLNDSSTIQALMNTFLGEAKPAYTLYHPSGKVLVKPTRMSQEPPKHTTITSRMHVINLRNAK